MATRQALRPGPWLIVLALTGCLGPATQATPVQAERLTLALCRALRLQYDAALGGALAPTSDELRLAWDDLRAGLRDAGIAPTSSADAVRAARDVLLAHDVIFLPPAVASGGDDDVDFAIARATAREAGLEREVAGRTVHYRRVEHRGVLLPDLRSYAALRRGDARWPVPLARRAGPTVYVDRLAVERQAGRGTAAHLSADALAEQVELRSVAELRFQGDLALAETEPIPRPKWIPTFYASVLLAAASEGDANYALSEITSLAERLPELETSIRERAVAPSLRALAPLVMGAAGAQEALDAIDSSLPPAQRARRALARVRASAGDEPPG